ncbi:class I SAM-dependent methyltransferase [Amycolatopsis sp. GM8]|uniref:class I SAM-dependent methyltransferase n=1 Tax=Amycolatopsis sp. GM8 TaxID=2896530 RepID=UPI001F29A9EB|nr:class I SAM-dependent methyltransferase [Amycolatopsis sp. GM8]
MSRTHTKTPSRADAVTAQFAGSPEVSEYAAAHSGGGTPARYYRSRFHAVDSVLAGCPGGELLDVGCGPGMLVEHLVRTRPDAFSITACDQSVAMIDAVTAKVGHREDVRVSLGSVEKMPFPDACFDVVLATGVLEYVNVDRALPEITRVLRPGGVAVVTMLNPLSPYRLVEWGLYWPARRVLGRVEAALGVPPQHRHGARRTGIRALPARRLRHKLSGAGLLVEDLVFYDVTYLVPPLDRLRRRRDDPDSTVRRRGVGRILGTAYLIAARTPGRSAP